MGIDVAVTTDTTTTTIATAEIKDEDRFLIPVPKHPVYGWRRFEQWPLIRPDPKSSDIVQGELGNCWFLSALSLIVERPELLGNVLVTSQDEFQRTRRATVRLFWQGKWINVQVDDWLPVNRSGNLVFSHAHRQQLFVPLVEKAIAKLFGGYIRLAGGGHISFGMNLLTGFPCRILPLRKDNEMISNEARFECWLQILSFNSAGYLQSVAAGPLSKNGAANGLLPNHAYSVLDVVSIDRHRLIRLRDPWSTTVWRGKWSNDCPRWTPELRRKLQVSTEESKQHGIFWISFDDLLRNFEEVVVCQILSQPYHQYVFEGSFPLQLNPDAAITFGTVFELINIGQPINGDAQIMATLFQHPKDGQTPINLPRTNHIALLVFELLPSSSSHVLGKFLTATRFAQRPSDSCQTELRPGHRYLLVALTFNPEPKPMQTQNENYILQLYSTKKLLIKENHNPNPGLIGDILITMARIFGKPYSRDDSKILTYHLSENFPGVVTVVENRNPKRWLRVGMNITPWLRTSHRMWSSRNSLQTFDLIAPGHLQMINVIAETQPSPEHDPSPPHTSIRMSFKWFQIDSIAVQQKKHQPDIIETYGMHCARPITALPTNQ